MMMLVQSVVPGGNEEKMDMVAWRGSTEGTVHSNISCRTTYYKVTANVTIQSLLLLVSVGEE